jgi:hypothetical protein
LSLRKVWSRLGRLSWDELRTRAAQEANKRADLARYRLGLGGAAPAPSALQPAALFANSSNFFFRPDEVPRRIQLLRQHLPNEVERIGAEADDICRHRFDLLGYKNLDYGAEIDWHLDAVHGKRSPLKPWFKISFLNFSEVGDHKVTWELNRHQHLVTIAKAWWLTKNPDYIREIEAQWYSWQKANPYPLGINWASSLEVAFRSLSWLWVGQLLQDCSRFQSKFRADLVRALRFNGRYIERYLSKYFSPNTHLLGEAVALFFIATLLPDFAESTRWQKLAWKTVVEESERQVRSDGVYFEQALYYHVYALDFFLHARMLALRNAIPIPSQFDDVLRRMLDVVDALAQGSLEGFGDDDGGRVFDPRRNRVEHMSDPLAIGAIEYGDPVWAARAQLTEEAIWLFGDRALTLLADTSPPPSVRAQAFESGGIYLLRDDHIDSDATLRQQLMIDAGPQGAGNSGHGHADALSVRFSINEHRVLVDPGTCCYISQGNERAAFRGTAAHNTLRVDEIDQAVPAGPFAWSSLPETRVGQWLRGETFSLFEAKHAGYRRLSDPVEHRRLVFHPNDAFWLIRDVVDGRQTHQLETFWHFAPRLDVRQEGNVLIASPVDRRGEHDGRHCWSLALLPENSPAWEAEITTGEISPAYGARESAPLVRLHARVPLPIETAALLVPIVNDAKAGEFTKLTKLPAEVQAYRYTVAQTSHHLFFCERTRDWSCRGWSSDARFLYARVEDGHLEHLVVCGGSQVKWQDRTLVSHRAPVERFELLGTQKGLEFASSDPAMLEQAIDGGSGPTSQLEASRPGEAQSEKAEAGKRSLEKARP